MKVSINILKTILNPLRCTQITLQPINAAEFSNFPKTIPTRMEFEPTLPDGNGLTVDRFNHVAILS